MDPELDSISETRITYMNKGISEKCNVARILRKKIQEENFEITNIRKQKTIQQRI